MSESTTKVPFNRPHMTGRELSYVAQAHQNSMLSGDGPFTKRCEHWLEATTGCRRALLTHSCTAALEMSALLAEVGAGDEVIMPSYTFVSTANAFVLRGAVPVFVDVRADTFNLDETLIESAITPRTRVIVPVHYAGVGCEMDPIMRIADQHGLIVIEDAAQGVRSSYRGRPLGGIGHLGAYSFHETKNIISGEGGALLINDDRFAERAEILREKGTNRRKLLQGLVDKYTWVDVGSSFLPGEIVAAFLLAQMEEADQITEARRRSWAAYHEAFAIDEKMGLCQRPIVPEHCSHNAHMYYLVLPSAEARSRFIAGMRACGINPVFHYVPLHSSPAGRKFCRTSGPLPVTDQAGACLVRLPMFHGLAEVQQRVITAAREQLALTQ